MSTFCGICEIFYDSEEQHREALKIVPKLRTAHGYWGLFISWVFPAPEDTMPSTHWFKEERATGSVEYYMLSPADTVYMLLQEHWKHLIDTRITNARATTTSIQRAKAEITPSIREWVDRLVLDEESYAVFEAILQSIGGQYDILRQPEMLKELLTRTAEVFDLPAYWNSI